MLRIYSLVIVLLLSCENNMNTGEISKNQNPQLIINPKQTKVIGRSTVSVGKYSGYTVSASRPIEWINWKLIKPNKELVDESLLTGYQSYFAKFDGANALGNWKLRIQIRFKDNPNYVSNEEFITKKILVVRD